MPRDRYLLDIGSCNVLLQRIPALILHCSNYLHPCRGADNAGWPAFAQLSLNIFNYATFGVQNLAQPALPSLRPPRMAEVPVLQEQKPVERRSRTGS